MLILSNLKPVAKTFWNGYIQVLRPRSRLLRPSIMTQKKLYTKRLQYPTELTMD